MWSVDRVRGAPTTLPTLVGKGVAMSGWSIHLVNGTSGSEGKWRGKF